MNPNIEKFRKSELLGKYTMKILFGWNDRKFKDKYLKFEEKLAKIEVSFSGGKTLKRDDIRVMNYRLYFIFLFYFFF